MTQNKTNIGIIGCGNISGIYIENARKFQNLNLVAIADRDHDHALAKQAEMQTKFPEHTPPTVLSVTDLLSHKDIHLVVNLTVPQAHAEVALQALNAGKHTYHEKPFALTRAEGQQILAAAKSKNLRVGCAPDTFLGAGIQTCRKIIDDGLIGEPVAATAFMTCPGHESWHPDPEFYYLKGGGPLMDMGPYYLTALVNLLGPVAKVAGFARITHPTRTITSDKKKGAIIPVETPTHIASSLQFAAGPLATMVMSFDVFGANLPRIEIYGTKGSLSVPDPNTFGGEVKLKMARDPWTTIPLSHPYAENSRGLGVADLASAIAHHRPARASGDLAFHILDVMQSCLETAQTGHTVELRSTVERPAPLPATLSPGKID